MSRTIAFSGISLVIFILLSCSQKQVSVEKSASIEPQFAKTDSAGKDSWQVEWEKTLQAAKKEEKVVVYTGFGGEPRVALRKGFKDSLGLNAEIISGSTREIGAKLLMENRAGLHLADIYMAGASAIFADVKPAGLPEYLPSALILPEVKDDKSWWNGGLNWMDDDKKVLSSLAYVPQSTWVNTNLVGEKELTSAKDLLNPKWKGKILMDDPSVGGPASTWFIVGVKHIGVDFMKEFVKQEPTIMRDFRLLVEWVAKGRFAISIGARPEVTLEFINTGAPLRNVKVPEIAWISGGSGTLTLMKAGPHPNAAKIFINWLLSREGATIFSRAHGAQSARMDVPTDFLNSDTLRAPNIDYFNVSLEKNQPLRDEGWKLAREIFGPLLK